MSPTVQGFGPGTRLFERFELVRKLGQGGMGVVWLARDHRLERDVALKFLPDAVRFDPDAIAELKRETRRALDLTHPNIVRIHDFEQSSEVACISMEYVDGRSLAEIKAARGCLEVDDVRPWLPALLDALRYAHEVAKVVHRDLKPANLMFTQDGELKITDFGIARSVADSVSRISMHRPTSGTPAYASPQQMQGEAPSPLDDVYAVGATLYDVLTGRPPFFRGDVIAQAHAATPPPLTERRTEFSYGTAPIPPKWEEVIAACLAKGRTERPGSIRELAARFSDAQSSASASPASPNAASPTPAEPRSRAALFIGIASFAAVSLGAGAYLATHRGVGPAPPTTPTPAPLAKPFPVAARLIQEARELRQRGALLNARERLEAALALEPRNATILAELAAIGRDMAPATPGASTPPLNAAKPRSATPAHVKMIRQITASSTLAPQTDESGRRNSYEASNVIDGNPSTAWVARRGAQDVRLEITFSEPASVSRFSIFPGYGKSRTAFTRNNRVQEFALRFPDGREERFQCADRMETQTFVLATPIVCETLTVRVLRVYEADKFTGDTPIAEIGF